MDPRRQMSVNQAKKTAAKASDDMKSLSDRVDLLTEIMSAGFSKTGERLNALDRFREAAVDLLGIETIQKRMDAFEEMRSEAIRSTSRAALLRLVGTGAAVKAADSDIIRRPVMPMDTLIVFREITPEGKVRPPAYGCMYVSQLQQDEQEALFGRGVGAEIKVHTGDKLVIDEIYVIDHSIRQRAEQEAVAQLRAEGVAAEAPPSPAPQADGQ